MAALSRPFTRPFTRSFTGDGGTALSSGGLFNFLLSQFRTTVPGTQTGTFQETHVYTGGTKWLLKANGFLGSTTAPAEPVLFDVSGNRLGIVLEPAATNQCLWSDDCTNAAWVKSNITAAKNATGADGVANSASTLTATSANGTCLQSFTSTIQNRAYAARVRRKTGTGDIQMTVDNGVTWTTVPTTSSWTRVNISQASVTNPIIGWRIVTSGDEIEVQLNQLENATLVSTSDIPTTTAAVTRTADTCYRIIGPERLVGATEGTLCADVTPYVVATSYIAVMDNGADNDKAQIYITGTSLRGASVDGGASQADVSTITAAVNTPIKVAFGFKANDFNAAANNTLGTLDSSGTLDTGFTHLRIGSRVSGDQFNGLFRNVKFWPTRLADATLQTLSNGIDTSGATLDFNYQTGVYSYAPINAGVTTTYTPATLISSGLMTLTGTPSAKWVRGPSGTLVQVAAGQIAIEYDVNGQPLGCINREPARTNLLLQSQTFDNASWTKSRVLAFGSGSIVNATTAPDGTTTADKIVEDTATGTHRVFQTTTITAGVNTTVSCWIKKAERTKAQLRLTSNGETVSVTASFDLDTGAFITQTTAGGATYISSKIETFLDGWYRCSLTGIVDPATTACTPTINILDASGSASYTGDGTSGLFIWGAQLEPGSYASSYIPTTTAAVTRNADQLRLNLGSWFDPSKWIIASKIFFPRTNATTGSALTALWELDLTTPSANNYAAAWLSSTNRIDFLERTNSTDGAAGNATTLSFPEVVRSAFGWSPSNAKAALNGSTVLLTGTPTAIANQQPFASIDLSDSQRANVDQGGGYLQAIAIYPVVPTQSNVDQYAGSI